MSQDTHLFSVRQPNRQTLGGLSYNAGSGIPQPASALKRSSSISNIGREPQTVAQHGRSQSSSRMSLAPGRPAQPSFQRSSSGTNLADQGRSTAQRSSSSMGYNGRMSYAPGAMTPAQPQMNASQSIQRRSSVYSRPSTSAPMSGQQSFFVQAPVPAGVPMDKRKLKDRGVQNQLCNELEEYLSNNGFQAEMKHVIRDLRNPMQKDFTMIFQWLYKRIDPAYQFHKSMDNEVPPILKQLRYPFEKSITKSQLMAVGGQNWSTFLGMLHWMMQLATMMDRFAEDRYDYACAEEGVDVSGDRIIFRFLSGAYQTWLSCPPGDEEDEDEADRLLVPHVEAMAAEFENGNQQYSEELKMLEAENEKLRREIEEAERETPDLPKLQAYVETLESDLKKFEAWQSNVVDKLKRHENRNEAIQKDIEDWEKQLDEASKEKTELQQAVDKQGISVSDIDRMNGERERLQSGVENARAQLDDLGRRNKDREADASEKLAALEGLARQFNSLCYDVGMRDQEFELILNINEQPFSSSQMGSSRPAGGDRLLADGDTGYHPSRILNLDLRGKIKGHINSLRKEINKRRNDSKDKDEDNRRLLFEISVAIDDKRHEVEALEHRVRSAEEEFEKTKEVTTTQKLASDAQIEKMEKELAKMRAGLTESVQLMEQREMNTNIEYEQLTSQANALREELHTEIERMLNDTIKFKVHIQKSLGEYEGFVAEEVEQELGSDETMEMRE